MRKFLKKYFIPHEHNDYSPHLFREATVSLLLFLAVFLFATSFGSNFVVTKTNLLGNVYSSVLVDLTNESRKENNEKELVTSSILTQVATLKAQDMAAKSYFAHTSPEGITPWHWFKEAGYNFSYAGENLAMDFHDSTDVENAWLASPTHRANILNDHFTEIGIATTTAMYNGRETTFVVQVFGKPKVSKIVPLQEKPTTNSGAQLASATTAAPEVRGASTQTPEVETVAQKDNMIVVANLDQLDEVPASESSDVASPVASSSSWIERVLLNQPHVVDYAYKAIMLVLFIGLVIYMGREMKIHHPRHVVYALLLLVIFASLLYLNQTFIITDKFLI